MCDITTDIVSIVVLHDLVKNSRAFEFLLTFTLVFLFNMFGIINGFEQSIVNSVEISFFITITVCLLYVAGKNPE